GPVIGEWVLTRSAESLISERDAAGTWGRWEGCAASPAHLNRRPAGCAQDEEVPLLASAPLPTTPPRGQSQWASVTETTPSAGCGGVGACDGTHAFGAAISSPMFRGTWRRLLSRQCRRGTAGHRRQPDSTRVTTRQGGFACAAFP